MEAKLHRRIYISRYVANIGQFCKKPQICIFYLYISMLFICTVLVKSSKKVELIWTIFVEFCIFCKYIGIFIFCASEISFPFPKNSKQIAENLKMF